MQTLLVRNIMSDNIQLLAVTSAYTWYTRESSPQAVSPPPLFTKSLGGQGKSLRPLEGSLWLAMPKDNGALKRMKLGIDYIFSSFNFFFNTAHMCDKSLQLTKHQKRDTTGLSFVLVRRHGVTLISIKLDFI